MGSGWDCAILGAGAAGLFCAGIAGQAGLRVLLIDHAPKVAEKIRISGGGRCNFTNRDASPAGFLSANPRFCRSALARYGAADFIGLVRRHGIAFHEKHRGQLFCDGASEQIIDMLLRECEAGGVTRWQPCAVHQVARAGAGFELQTAGGSVQAARVVVATGGPSIPQLGATDFGYRLARRFGHALADPRPGLVPLTFDATTWAPFASMAGVSLPVGIEAGRGAMQGRFTEDLLFTHRGLSGPAVLQASSYWHAGETLRIDLAPERDLAGALIAAKAGSKRQLGNQLAEVLPQRLAQAWLAQRRLPGEQPMPQLRDSDLRALAAQLKHWELKPDGSEGWRKAEVAAGGVDTRQLSSQTLQSALVPGLYFIGEVVDVTGWLGGYNFQWAWSSAAACARAMAAQA
jgi:predicted Rossmann fold flavoprotein